MLRETKCQAFINATKKVITLMLHWVTLSSLVAILEITNVKKDFSFTVD